MTGKAGRVKGRVGKRKKDGGKKERCDCKDDLQDPWPRMRSVQGEFSAWIMCVRRVGVKEKDIITRFVIIEA